MGWKTLSGLAACFVILMLVLIVIGFQNQFPKRVDSSVPASTPTKQPLADNADPSDQADATYNPFDPPIARLTHLQAKVDIGHASRFFIALAAVLEQNKIELKDYDPDCFMDEGSAVRVGDDSNSAVLAILGGWDHSSSPGAVKQSLLLLDAQGNILDRFSCAARDSAARGLAATATLRTERVYAPRQTDPLFAIRLMPPREKGNAGNWSYKIVYGGQSHTYPWKVTEPPDDLENKGLCRVAIRDGRFVVVFPELKNSTE